MYIKKRVADVVVVGFLTLLFLTGLASAFMIPQTVEQLAANSNHVIRAAVESQASNWNDSHNFIYTYVTLRVVETYKGGLPASVSITVQVPGGTVGDTSLIVEHSPCFNAGEEVITFLKERGSFHTITSREQGKYTIVNGEVREKRIPLSAFVQSIRNAVGR